MVFSVTVRESRYHVAWRKLFLIRLLLEVLNHARDGEEIDRAISNQAMLWCPFKNGLNNEKNHV